MDYFYDGQIRRYITQFMRVFIGFRYKDGDGDEKSVPVMYGDLTRQVANIIKENSENKLPTVPRIACYITGLELDTSRLSDPTFVSKVNIRERRYTEGENGRTYEEVQGGFYTVERLMPTPFKLTVKADIWTSNTDQKLQLLEQILVLFNPSLELQTTDNYLDWTSLSVLNLSGIQYSSRNIPVGTESDIEICSMTFDIPIWITPPAKVKKLGIIQTIIANVFTEQGDILSLEDLVYNQTPGDWSVTSVDFSVLLFKSQNGQGRDYDVTIIDPGSVILKADLEGKSSKLGDPGDWNRVMEIYGGVKPGSRLYFKQPNGYEIVGTFVINTLDPSKLVVTFDQDTMPENTVIVSDFNPTGKTVIDAIVDPYKYNPLTKQNGRIPGVRYLMLEDVNPGGVNQDGPAAWKNLDGSDPVIAANSIIEWDGSEWIQIWDPATGEDPTYVQNLRTGIQYRWDGQQWLKSFEGEYRPGSWGFVLNP